MPGEVTSLISASSLHKHLGFTSRRLLVSDFKASDFGSRFEQLGTASQCYSRGVNFPKQCEPSSRVQQSVGKAYRQYFSRM